MNNKCCVQRSTARVYSVDTSTVLTNETIDLNIARVTGNSITVAPNGVNLKKPGLYLVMVNATAVESGTAGDITVQLMSNGDTVTAALGTEYSGADTDVVNIAFSTILTVECDNCKYSNNDRVLTLRNTGVGATYSNVELTIFKID